MLIECMLWGRAQGFRWFNLGMAPLSGLEEHALAPAWHKLGRMVTRYGGNVLQLRGTAQIQAEIRSGLAPSIPGGPGWSRHGRRLARRDCADIGRRAQRAAQVALDELALDFLGDPRASSAGIAPPPFAAAPRWPHIGP